MVHESNIHTRSYHFDYDMHMNMCLERDIGTAKPGDVYDLCTTVVILGCTWSLKLVGPLHVAAEYDTRAPNTK